MVPTLLRRSSNYLRNKKKNQTIHTVSMGKLHSEVSHLLKLRDLEGKIQSGDSVRTPGKLEKSGVRSWPGRNSSCYILRVFLHHLGNLKNNNNLIFPHNHIEVHYYLAMWIVCNIFK